jgi:hypothetical protein
MERGESNSNRREPEGSRPAVPQPTIADDLGIPDWLRIAAIPVGLLLTAVGTWITLQQAGYTYHTHYGALILCSGLGIVLTAMGGRVVGTWGKFAFVGAVAAAPLLFFLQ